MYVSGSSPRTCGFVFFRFLLHSLLCNLLNNLLNKCLGSASFLCSAFTWMQIHMNLTSAGNWWQLALTGWERKPYSNPFPCSLPTRESQHHSPLIVPPTWRSVLAGELKLLQTRRRSISCWKSLAKLSILVAPDGSCLGTVLVGSPLCHQAGSHFCLSNSSFSLSHVLLVITRRKRFPLQASPYLESACFCSSFVEQFLLMVKAGRWLQDACQKASPARAVVGRTDLTAHSQDIIESYNTRMVCVRRHLKTPCPSYADAPELNVELQVYVCVCVSPEWSRGGESPSSACCSCCWGCSPTVQSNRWWRNSNIETLKHIGKKWMWAPVCSHIRYLLRAAESRGSPAFWVSVHFGSSNKNITWAGM